MARPLRIQNKGRWYNVINRGIDRVSIYRDARESTGLTLRKLGELAGEMNYAAVGEAVRRLRKRLKEDRSVRRVYKYALQIAC